MPEEVLAILLSISTEITPSPPAGKADPQHVKRTRMKQPEVVNKKKNGVF